MEFALRKDGSGKQFVSDTELAKMFDLASLREKLKSLEAKVEELQKSPVIDKKYVLSLIDSDFLKKGDVLNISNASSIEKLKSVPNGAIYYNTTKGVRLKTKEGWINFKTN